MEINYRFYFPIFKDILRSIIAYNSLLTREKFNYMIGIVDR